MLLNPWLAAAMLCLSMAFNSSAQAFVCSRVPDANGGPGGASTAWFSRTLTFSLNQDGTAQLSRDETFSTLRKAFATWQSVRLRSDQDPKCNALIPNQENFGTNLTFIERPASAQDYVGYNWLDPQKNENVLVFRDNGWPHVSDDRANIIALTTTTYNALTGEIFDADIEFNSTEFVFTVADSHIETDLLNTATHEIGHFLGFAHSPEPSATMFYRAPAGETIKRYLSCDDAALLIFRYPLNSESIGYCSATAVDSTCGFCAPPDLLKRRPKISVADYDDGRGGCQALHANFFALFVSTVGLLVRGRRAKQRG